MTTLKNTWQETGHNSMAERAQEAQRLVEQISDAYEMMEPRERRFVEQISDRLDQFGEKTFVATKALFWLRDLKDKY